MSRRRRPRRRLSVALLAMQVRRYGLAALVGLTAIGAIITAVAGSGHP